MKLHWRKVDRHSRGAKLVDLPDLNDRFAEPDRPGMTVAELKELLLGLPDDTEILVEIRSGEGFAEEYATGDHVWLAAARLYFRPEWQGEETRYPPQLTFSLMARYQGYDGLQPVFYRAHEALSMLRRTKYAARRLAETVDDLLQNLPRGEEADLETDGGESNG
jgi:hypothetical protein